MQAFWSLHSPAPGFTAYELGTGWFPIIPIGLYLCGAATHPGGGVMGACGRNAARGATGRLGLQAA